MRLLLGDCLDKLKELEDNSLDSIVTDPPYGLSFMGKKWDYDVPSVEIWEECMRVLKPGGHLLSFAGSRTYHRMAVRIEDAGFEIRDQLMWIYGSGFPKSLNIGKGVNEKLGNEREVVGTVREGRKTEDCYSGKLGTEADITKGNSEWEGWGTALKPAHEPIVMARKPLSEKTVVDNVLEWGTGGINIDDSRIGTDEVITTHARNSKSEHFGQIQNHGTYQSKGQELGRFPANIIFDEEAGKILDEQSGFSRGDSRTSKSTYDKGIWGNANPVESTALYGDSGGASRFFYCPKTSKRDRNEGLESFPIKSTSSMPGRRNAEDMSEYKIDNDVTGRFVTQKQNTHPTVKPTGLMAYLIRLVTPKGGTTLDPFMGSGSTGKAAVRGGFDFIGIEREKEYMEIAQSRIQYEIDNPYNEEKEERIELNKNSQKFW